MTPRTDMSTNSLPARTARGRQTPNHDHVSSPISERRPADAATVARAARELLIALGGDLEAHGLQLQERLTVQIAGLLERELQPKGVGAVIEAEHLCRSLRGVQKPGAKTITSALRGLVRDDPRTREEFLSLTGRRTR